MSGLSRHRKAITVALLASAAVLVSFALTYPKTVSHPLLGSDWRCSRTAFLTHSDCHYLFRVLRRPVGISTLGQGRTISRRENDLQIVMISRSNTITT